MYRFEQQFRSMYYTVNQATVLNATDILWKDSKSNMRNKRNNYFFLAGFSCFFLCTFFFLNEQNLVYEQSSTDKKNILMKYFLQ